MKKKYTKGLMWFRRDLRLTDNAALYHALKQCDTVFCIFVFDKAILDIRSQFKFKPFATLRVVRGVTGWDVFLKTNVGEKVHLRCDCYGLKNSSDAFYMTNEEKMAYMEMHVCQFCVDNSRDNYDYPNPFDLAR